MNLSETESKHESFRERLVRLVRGPRPRLTGSLKELVEAIPADHPDAALDTEEMQLLQNFLSARARAVSELMVPRADIVAVAHDTPRADVVELLRREGHTRLPVFRDSLDTVLGYLHAKDLLLNGKAGEGKESTWIEPMLRPVLFAAPSMRSLDLLRMMRTKKIHIALVVDEFGGIDGLATIEDLMEEFVGEIEDEHDTEESPPPRKLEDGSFVVEASARLETLPENLGAKLAAFAEAEDIDTIGGFAASLAHRVPQSGEELFHRESGLSLVVLQATPRRIIRLRLVPPPA